MESLTISEKILFDRVEKLQKELQDNVDLVKGAGTNASYQDIVNVLLLKKIAQLELKIENIKK